MKKKEREAVDAIASVFEIALPVIGGTQSTTVAGVAGYAHDMRRAIPCALRIVWVLRRGESYPGELAEEIEATKAIVREITAPAPGQEGGGQ